MAKKTNDGFLKMVTRGETDASQGMGGGCSNPPSSGVMKPKPRSEFHFFTTPVRAIVADNRGRIQAEEKGKREEYKTCKRSPARKHPTTETTQAGRKVRRSIRLRASD